jgi:Omp85 superfamily domain
VPTRPELQRLAAILTPSVAMLCAAIAVAQPTPPELKDDSEQASAPPGLGLLRWINPDTAPFIPVPVIGVDPNSGTTLGVLPTWVHSNEQGEISRIVAPDLIHNPNFGWGAHGRIFDYPSDNTQWSLIGTLSQRVQRGVDFEYQTELTRHELWSFSYSLIYDQDGTQRFFGIGSHSREKNETDYTKSQELGELQAGLNLSHAWQLLFTVRPQRYEVRPGTLNGIETIEERFPTLNGLGTTTSLLERISVNYDTRDSRAIPTEGLQVVMYGGLASRHGVLNDSMYSEAGLDARSFWTVAPQTVLAAHLALRYTPSAHDIPFWAYSSLGGDRDYVGGAQELRGYGAGRFYDRNSFASSVELRKKLFGFDASTSHVDIEVTPFIDVGDVASSGTPLNHLHNVAGVGFRGVARPFIVGYVDLGFGNEGVAAFTGIDYPF